MSDKELVKAEVEMPSAAPKRKKKENIQKEVKDNVDSIYSLYLDIPEYKFKLREDEYTEEEGKVLIGRYRDRKIAMVNTLKYMNKGLLVSLVVN